jgi:phosphoglycerate dehydrogenase-like enzyme
VICWVHDALGREAFGPPPDGWIAEDYPDRQSSAWARTRERVQVVIPEHVNGLDLDALPALRLVQTRSAGVDWIIGQIPDGVTLCDAAGARDGAMAEWVVAAILADYKRARTYVELLAEHRWEHIDDLLDVSGARVLILGFGAIGRAVEERLTPFGTSFVRVARTGRDGVRAVGDLPSLLPDADVIINLLPLTDGTRGLLGAEMLSLMHDGALFVNAGRGATVDTAALVGELRAGRIRAVLDVVDPEPLPADHPLWTLSSVILSPHSAGDTIGAERAAWRLAWEQLHRYAAGEPLLNVVSDGY